VVGASVENREQTNEVETQTGMRNNTAMHNYSNVRKDYIMRRCRCPHGKIWILTDNTEEGIATELLEHGISKDRIVLGFYPPALREMGEFAVA
jgi:hypothetical protein